MTVRRQPQQDRAAATVAAVLQAARALLQERDLADITVRTVASSHAPLDAELPSGGWPLGALIVLYGVTLFATELLSNATVAVLVTPIAVALAESLGVDPRPFLVAVMMAASAAFATPFGYQTNALVFTMGKYRYMDFVRVGLPLDLLTWAVACAVIPIVLRF